MASLATSMRDVKRTVDNLGEKMEVDVKNLEAKMAAGFRNEGTQRNKYYDDLEEE